MRFIVVHPSGKREECTAEGENFNLGLAAQKHTCVAEGTHVWEAGERSVIEHAPSRLYQGLALAVKLKTERGFELSCTPDHQVLTSIGWKRADQACDLLSLLGNQIAVNEQAPSVEVAEVLGYLTGDGYIGQGRNMGMLYTEEDVLRRHASIIESEVHNFSERSHGPGIVLLTSGRLSAHQWARGWGLSSSPAHLKTFPPATSWGRDQLKAFLRGLLEADGSASISRRRISFTTTSKDLALGVHDICRAPAQKIRETCDEIKFSSAKK